MVLYSVIYDFDSFSRWMLDYYSVLPTVGAATVLAVGRLSSEHSHTLILLTHTQ